MSREEEAEIYAFKLLTQEELDQFQETGEFSGTPLDNKDGYIHMSSNPPQYNRVLKKYYTGKSPVYLLHIRTSKLENLKYERISNGDVYPHQYGKLLYTRDVDKIETVQ
jgi:uncharacterized protein (DUF952 family)